MAELKKLNGYEIVDQTARDTKQNNVLYGSSDPSNTTGTNGDLYISTNGVDVINDLQSQINTNKNTITKKLTANFFSFPQQNKPSTLQFSGNATTRAIRAIILLSGQSGVIPPIPVSFKGETEWTNISNRDTIVSDNSYNITSGSNGTVNIPANIKGGWGIISVLVLDGDLSVSISYKS